MRTTTRTMAAFLGLVIAWGIAGPAAAGTIKGTIRLAGGPIEAKKLKVTVDHGVCGTVKDAEDLVVSADMGIQNAVVSLRLPHRMPGGMSPHPSRQIRSSVCSFPA